ncbi:BRO family protein [uncultured Alistipes sp.]|nr:BRO family protein [uncultured Alistipes sp.]
MIKTLTIQSKLGQVRYSTIKGEPWFAAKDVCDILGIVNSRDTLAKLLDDDEKGVATIDTPGGPQELATVNESGMYHLIFQSRKSKAKAFRRWVTSEVLPSIRKYGYYIAPETSASRRQRRLIEKQLCEQLGKYLTTEDIYNVSKRLRLEEDYVTRVMRGVIRDNDVMRLLQDRAVKNKENWEDAYAVDRMDEIVARLK